ncbi:hypothetical protein B0T18DRAFT_96192 [Schizothecium vesticola]|uniref:Uncharacterized protein n=1 Tax=Schizothecium vesticola TaxID=314040 RepID=A0AA40F0R5_9PEZI|nr:hypothetical protein B0T18DRAFT_96192 [Schizothecium vesticola]
MWKPRSIHGRKGKWIVEGIAGLLVILETTEARPVAGAIEDKSLNSPHLAADAAASPQIYSAVPAPWPNPRNLGDHAERAANVSTCLTLPPSELVALSVPGEELRQLIVDCPEICLVASGKGQPDLAGRGVIISYCGQLFYAILFGPVKYASSTLLAAWRPSSSDKQPRWMTKLHSTAIWTNVLFCLAVSLACCVRQYRSDLEPYERSLTRRIVGFTQYCTALALSGYLTPERGWLLSFCLVIIVTTGTAAEVAAGLPAHRTMDGILQACRDALKEESYPWFGAITLPYVIKDRILFMCLALCALGAWTAVWVYLRCSLRRRQVAGPRYAIFAFFVLMLGILGFAAYSLGKTVEKHVCLSYAPATEDNGETHWGIGQIVAPFAWLGLTVDILYELADPDGDPEIPPLSHRISRAVGTVFQAGLRRATPRNLHLSFQRTMRTATALAQTPKPSPGTSSFGKELLPFNPGPRHIAVAQGAEPGSSNGPQNVQDGSAPAHAAATEERREHSTTAPSGEAP